MVYRAIESAHEALSVVCGDGEGVEGIWWCMGRWEGRGSDGVVYGAMGRAQEGWGGVWGDGKGACGLGWCMGR